MSNISNEFDPVKYEQEWRGTHGIFPIEPEHLIHELCKCKNRFITLSGRAPIGIRMHPNTFITICLETFVGNFDRHGRKRLIEILTSNDTKICGMKIIKDELLPLNYFLIH